MSAVLALLVKGGPVMAPLAVCSILSLATILERAWFWIRTAGARDAEHILELSSRGKWEDALNTGRESRSPLARVLAAGVANRQTKPALAMESTAHEELGRMRRGL